MSWSRRNDHQTEHRYIEDRLSAYLDGELTPKERAAVDAHLATCRACRLSLETMRQTIRWTRGLKPVPLPRVFTIQAPPQPVRAARPGLALPLMRAATVAVAVLFLVAVAGQLALTGLLPPQPTQSVALLEAPAATLVVEENPVTLQAPAPSAPLAESQPAQPPAAAQEYVPEPAATAAALAPTLEPPAGLPQSEQTRAAEEAAREAPPGMGMGGTEPAATEAAAEAKLAGQPQPTLTAPGPELTPTETLTPSMAMMAIEAFTATETLTATEVFTATEVITATGVFTATEMTATLDSIVPSDTIAAGTFFTPTWTATPAPTTLQAGALPPAARPSLTETPVETPRPTTTPIPTRPSLPTASPVPPAVFAQAPEPTIVAAAPAAPHEAARLSGFEQVQQTVGPWLKPAAEGLAGLLIVLAAATLYLGIRWRRRTQ